MSELQAQTGTVAPTSVAEVPALAQTPGRSYWQIVRRAYFSRIIQTVAVIYVLAIAVLAVIVPFLANGRPYVASVDGVKHYPLFKSLTTVDLLLLVAAFELIVYLTVHFVSARFSLELRGALRRWTLIGVVCLFVVWSNLIIIFHHDYNDLLTREDYKSLTPDYDVKDAVFAPISWGFSDAETPFRPQVVFQDPSPTHLLGTDGSGRDTVARLLWSARIVFGIGLISEFIALAIGIVYGALMGYFGGTVDILGSRFIELVEGIPTLFLIIIFVAVFGRDIFIIMAIIGATSWTGIARFVRAEFYKLRKMDYVSAAVASGLPLHSILFRHILPNGLTPVLVNATFGIAGTVGIESGLSFLGLGVEPPMPSWGSMLNEAGNPADIFHFWLALPPGFMIFLTIFMYNIIGEGLRDALDPRLNRLE